MSAIRNKITAWEDLPVNLLEYLKVIEEIVACPIVIASIGAERESTLFSSAGAFVKSFVD